MRGRLAMLLLVLGCGSLASCGVSVIAHDEQAAAKTAAKFADLAIVRSDYPAAHAMLTKPLQETLPSDKLGDEIAKFHPTSRPTKIVAVEFEPIPGQRAMNIYLKGSRGEEAFYYRVRMVGDAGSGYQVDFVGRGSGPYPPSGRRPL
jgi:hypothetical protein